MIGEYLYLFHSHDNDARLVLYLLITVDFHDTQSLMKNKDKSNTTLITGKEGKVFLTCGIS